MEKNKMLLILVASCIFTGSDYRKTATAKTIKQQ